MKKVILLFSALLISVFSVLNAQELKMEIYNASGELIENGTNLFSIADQSSKTIKTDSLFIKNVSDNTIKLKVRRMMVALVSFPHWLKIWVPMKV